MTYTADNAIILAAGFASRFVPLSYETPKALLRVRGEVLIERQIRQLREAGINDIVVVTGYKAEQFAYLRDAYDVTLVFNPEYAVRNNHSSIYAVRDFLRNSYVCSSDNYFTENPFTLQVGDAYYAAVYTQGATQEWCMTEGADGFINTVCIGGRDTWTMLGHTFWSEPFSRAFLRILRQEYSAPQTTDQLWEGIFIRHLDELKMRMKKYPDGVIYEFDTLDELRAFDGSYTDDTRCAVIRKLARQLGCSEREMVGFQRTNADASAFSFYLHGQKYICSASGERLERMV